MNNKTNSTLPPEPETAKPEQVDEARRRLGKVGVAGSGVILTLASRSVLGGWGTCTGSEMMSGNLSRPGEANYCGCSPGYWGNKNGYATWTDQIGKLINSSHSPTSKFNTVFGVAFYGPNTGSALTTYGSKVTLWQAVHDKQSTNPIISCSGVNEQTAGFHAVAALMNASVYGSRYPTPYQTANAVITAFSGAASNCALLGAFITKVDVYESNSTWCFGEKHL
ncbi:MAG: hypothetical protein ACYCZA_00590 [Thiobacillus sp.]